MTSGSLTVVGTGIAFGVQLTPQARAAIEGADDVFYLLAEPTAERWFPSVHANTHSLRHHYARGRPRSDTYAAMVDEMLDGVRKGRHVCAAFYGHPGVFASPAHAAVRRAREEGFAAVMLPAISAEDCLFADLGVDPGERGCQSFEASDFLLRRRAFDTTVPLVLWQIALIGVPDVPLAAAMGAFGILADYLADAYGESHPAVVYQASPYPVGAPSIREFTLATVRNAELIGMSTLYVPPLPDRDADEEMRARLAAANVESPPETL